MNIINTTVVKSTADVFWNGAPALSNMPPKPVLILSTPLVEGSADDVRLQRMVKAMELPENSHNLVYLPEGDKMAWHAIREQLKPSFVFTLGVLPSQLGISALFRYCVANRYDNAIWLPAPSVIELGQNDELRKQLWENGMKTIFVLKEFGEIMN